MSCNHTIGYLRDDVPLVLADLPRGALISAAQVDQVLAECRAYFNFHPATRAMIERFVSDDDDYLLQELLQEFRFCPHCGASLIENGKLLYRSTQSASMEGTKQF